MSARTADAGALDTPIAVTVFRDHGAASKQQIATSLRDLLHLLRVTTGASKAALPWLKLAAFGDVRTDRGSLRHDANVIEIGGIEADYDGEQIAPERALEMLRAANLAAVVYTSPSHSPNAPRWRVLCPTSRPMPPADRARLVARLNGLFLGTLARESFTLSQAYYFGAVVGQTAHSVDAVDGRAIDLAHDLDAGAVGRPERVRLTGDVIAFPARSAFQDHDATPYGRRALENECAAVRHAPNGAKHDTLNKAAYSIGGLVAAGQIQDGAALAELTAALHDMHARNPCEDFRHAERTLAKAFRDGMAKPRAVEARHAPPRSAMRLDNGYRAMQTETPPETPGADARPNSEAAPRLSEDSIALDFSDMHAGELLYVAEWGQWLRCDGARYAPDTTRAVPHLVREKCREAAAEAEAERSENQTQRIASWRTVSAVEQLARTDRRHAREGAAFDADPWLLNTPGGVVDLRTGRTREHRRGDLHTKIAGAAPGGDCSRWLAFLAEAFEGNAEMLAYTQRWAGYCLTGLTREHAFAFLYGPGGNGKSVLLNTLSAMLGDYAVAADMTLFAAGEVRHETGLARLRGARLVTASETEAGQALAEAKVKLLTGGDPITARFMRADFFTFVPAFKLVMAGNHRPVLRNPDAAMSRRLHLVPMLHVPPAPDHTLGEALRAELGGILAWAIEGCRMWQRDGLGKPAVVAGATADYFAEQDLLAQWLDERCETLISASAPFSALFRDWSAWAHERGEVAGTSKAFSASLERHHAKRRLKSGPVFVGLRLRPSDTGAW